MKKQLIVSAQQRRGVDLRPRHGLGPANAYLDLNALWLLMTPLTGSSAEGRTGTFAQTTTPGNYGWLAVRASVTEAGLTIHDGLGTGFWNGAGMPGDNSGGGPDPCESTILYGGWRFFRQDFVHANPSLGNYTIS